MTHTLSKENRGHCIQMSVLYRSDSCARINIRLRTMPLFICQRNLAEYFFSVRAAAQVAVLVCLSYVRGAQRAVKHLRIGSRCIAPPCLFRVVPISRTAD